jgi:hypothetical protein
MSPAGIAPLVEDWHYAAAGLLRLNIAGMSKRPSTERLFRNRQQLL